MENRLEGSPGDIARLWWFSRREMRAASTRLVVVEMERSGSYMWIM